MESPPDRVSRLHILKSGFQQGRAVSKEATVVEAD